MCGLKYGHVFVLATISTLLPQPTPKFKKIISTDSVRNTT